MTIFHCEFSPYGCDNKTSHMIESRDGKDALRRAMATHGGSADQWRVSNTKIEPAINHAMLRHATAETTKDAEFWHRLIGSLRKASTL